MNKKIILAILITGAIAFQVLPMTAHAQSDPEITQELSDIFFTDAQNGWVIGDSGFIARSTDGGNSWNKSPTSVLDSLTTLFFIDSATGWVGGENGLIISTINSGETWQDRSGSFDETIRDIHFIDDSLGYSLSSNAVRKTLDAGISWEEVNGLSQSSMLQDLEVLDPDIFWVLGSSSDLFRTIDGGNSFDTTLVGWINTGNSSYSHTMITSWNDTSAMIVGGSCVDILLNGILTCSGHSFVANRGEDLDGFPSNIISFNDGLKASERIGEEHGWVVGDSGLIAMTDSAGHKWKIQESGTFSDLFAMSFVDSLTGWVLGKNNLILHTTDGGDNWGTLISIENQEYSIPTGFTLKQYYPNPFNPVTTISFEIIRPGNIKLSIYDIRGREVFRLIDGFRTSGEYEVTWNGLDSNRNEVASGVYFATLRSDDKSIRTIKLILLR